MFPILLRCVGLPVLKLLSMAALLVAVLMWADPRVWAQDGKAGAAEDEKGAADDKADGADQPEEPAAVVNLGNYQYIKPTVDRTQKSVETQIHQIAGKETYDPGQQAQFDQFFRTYFFPAWADPTTISKVPEQRKNLRNFFNQTRNDQIHDHLLTLSMQYLTILAEKNFHPATRYNAVLAIGELNDSEASGRNPAVPHAGALAPLVEWVKKGPSDAARVAALRGLLRHCTLGIASTQSRDTAVIPTLLEVAKSRPPKDRSPEGHAWMRTLAIQSLAALKAPGVASNAAVGPNGVADAMVATVGDPASPLAVRCAAARALGSISPAPPFSTTPAQLAALLRQLTADFCAAELAREKKFPDSPVFRREVRQRLDDIKFVVDGKDNEQPLGEAAADLSAEVRSLIAQLDVKDVADEVMAAAIEKTAGKLRVQTPAAAAATP